jgi:hypothetical protein
VFDWSSTLLPLGLLARTDDTYDGRPTEPTDQTTETFFALLLGID